MYEYGLEGRKAGRKEGGGCRIEQGDGEIVQVKRVDCERKEKDGTEGPRKKNERERKQSENQRNQRTNKQGTMEAWN